MLVPRGELQLPNWLRTALLVGLPVLLIGLAWLPGASAPYQYDDYLTPVKDPASQSLGAFVEALPRTLRPLTKLTYASESSLGAVSAPARRVLNALLLLLSAGLLARLCSRVGLAREAAVALATLWAVHPVHGELVIALAGRSVLLCLCLTLASALLVLEERPAAALTCALLAVLARETALPWLVVCAGFVSYRPGRTRALLASLLGALLVGALLLLASSRLRGLLQFAYEDPRAVDQLGLQWAALSRGTLLWLFQPAAFTVDMGFAPTGAARLSYVLGAFGMYAAAGWLSCRGPTRAVRLLALLWLCLVFPLHSVMPKLDPLTARSVSASSVALTALLALRLAQPLKRSRVRVVFWTSVCVAAALLVATTRGKAALYRDPIALWQDAATRSHYGIRPHLNLATLLAQKGRLTEARSVLLEATRREPFSTEAREKLRAVDVLRETETLLKAP